MLKSGATTIQPDGIYTWSELCKGILATVVCKPHG